MGVTVGCDLFGKRGSDALYVGKHGRQWSAEGDTPDKLFLFASFGTVYDRDDINCMGFTELDECSACLGALCLRVHDTGLDHAAGRIKTDKFAKPV